MHTLQWKLLLAPKPFLRFASGEVSYPLDNNIGLASCRLYTSVQNMKVSASAEVAATKECKIMLFTFSISHVS
jgi:hypothetical protein